MSKLTLSKPEPRGAPKKPIEASEVQATRQKIEEDRKLEASALEQSNKLTETLPPPEKKSELTIEAAQGSQEAKRQLAEVDATNRKLEELAELIQALHARRPRLERELDEAIVVEKREKRRCLADQEGELAEQIETGLKKVAPWMAEWTAKDLEISTLTRGLGESVGLSPQRKLYETLCQHFWPIIGKHGKHLQRPSLTGDLVTWSKRFASQGDEKQKGGDNR